MALVQLTGSEKQVKWATDIRRGFVDRSIQKKLAGMAQPSQADYDEIVRVAEASVNDQPTARFWIDNRNWLNASHRK